MGCPSPPLRICAALQVCFGLAFGFGLGRKRIAFSGQRTADSTQILIDGDCGFG